MKHLKSYNLFESKDDNIILDIADCYMDLFDEYNMKEFKLEELPGYKGIPEREKNSERPYAKIDSVNNISVPHDAIVWSNCTKDKFANEERRDDYLKSLNYIYFVIKYNNDKINPGYTIVIYSKNIIECFADKSKGFDFIKNYKLRRLVSECSDRILDYLNVKEEPTIYSFENECIINFYLNPYRFKRSDLARDYSRGFISKEKYERLLKNAI